MFFWASRWWSHRTFPRFNRPGGNAFLERYRDLAQTGQLPPREKRLFFRSFFLKPGADWWLCFCGDIFVVVLLWLIFLEGPADQSQTQLIWWIFKLNKHTRFSGKYMNWQYIFLFLRLSNYHRFYFFGNGLSALGYPASSSKSKPLGSVQVQAFHFATLFQQLPQWHGNRENPFLAACYSS